MKKRALLSVFNKEGIVEIAKVLVGCGVEILSTGGTAKTLKEAGIEVTDVSEYTSFEEIMNGRVKTLHPKIYAGVLGIRSEEAHQKDLSQVNGGWIDFVIVNLYPFKKVVSQKESTFAEAIENIDIGGPTMVRAAAKNHQDVNIVVDTGDYDLLRKELERGNGETTLEFRQKMAIKAFSYTYQYDNDIHNYLLSTFENKEIVSIHYEKVQTLRYGENPHQKSIMYKVPGIFSMESAQLLHGKQMSFNNYQDLYFAYHSVAEFSHTQAVSIIKHGNPCGYAVSENISEALKKAWEGDIVSAFGSVIVSTREVTEEFAQFISERFVEVLLAPSFHKNAMEILTQKKNIRLLQMPVEKQLGLKFFRRLDGFLMVQDKDNIVYDKLNRVSGEEEIDKGLCYFTYAVSKHLKSNAIAIGYEYKKGSYMLLGMGAGQTNRIDALKKLAIPKAKENIERLWGKEKIESILAESMVASDAFLPFNDVLEELSKEGIKRIIQPGGSLNDESAIAFCKEKGLTMYFTGVRHFLH